MQLVVAGRHALLRGLRALAPDAIVYATTKPSPWLVPRLRSSAHHPFDQRAIELHFADVVEPAHPLAFRLEDLQRAFAHVDALQPERLLVMCNAGLSRSPALALAIAARLSGRPEDECEALRRAGAHLQPNPLVLHLADEELELGGRLSRAAAQAFPPRQRGRYGALGARRSAVSWTTGAGPAYPCLF